MSEPTAPARAGRLQWLGLVVLVLPCLLVSMDLSVLFFALPFLSADLQPTSAQSLWILDSYGFVLASLLITMGSLGDRIGRRRLLLVGAVVFGVGSVIAAYSVSSEMLIAARFLLGVGGATLAPSTLSLIRTMFLDERQRRTAIGIWTGGFVGGGVFGPVAGGVLLEHFWWGSAFLINVPVMVMLLVFGRLLLPEFRTPAAGRLDVLSSLLSLGAVLPSIYGLKKAAEDGLGEPTWIAAVALGGVLGWLFVRRQRRLADPMIDLSLFGRRTFSASILANALTQFAMMGILMYLAQYLQLVLDMSPLAAALWTLPAFVGMPIGIGLVTVLGRYVGPGYLVGVGLTVAAGGMLVFLRAGVESGVGVIVVASAVMVAGIGGVGALATDLVVAAAPAERVGAASATSETGNEFGAALGMAVLGSVGTAVYRGQLAGELPATLPPEAREAARDTLGGARAVAGDLPASLGEPLLMAAREAFVRGIHVTVVVAATILVTTGILAAFLLRAVRPGTDRDRSAEEVEESVAG